MVAISRYSQITFTDLLNPEGATPLMASSRMQRRALTLLAHGYALVYSPGSQNGNADALSRLALPDVPETTPIPGDIVHLLESIHISPVNATKVKLWTRCDQVLSQVLQFVHQGCPMTIEDDTIKPFYARREELIV